MSLGGQGLVDSRQRFTNSRSVVLNDAITYEIEP